MSANWGIRLAFVVGIALSTPAWSATVEVVKGEVSVKQAEGFQRVAAAMEVYPGNQVMVAPGGRAKIVYPDGCAIPVYPGSVVAVPKKCYQPMRAGLEPVVEERPFPWVPVILGAAIVGGGICAVVCGDDDDGGGVPPPRSP